MSVQGFAPLTADSLGAHNGGGAAMYERPALDAQSVMSNVSAAEVSVIVCVCVCVCCSPPSCLTLVCYLSCLSLSQSIRSVHSKRSLQKVIDREKTIVTTVRSPNRPSGSAPMVLALTNSPRDNNHTQMPSIDEAPAPAPPPPVIITVRAAPATL